MSELRDKVREEIGDIIREHFDDEEITDLILEIEGLAIVDRESQIKISISCGRSTDYADEYWIEDKNGEPIDASDFGERDGDYIKEEKE